MNSKYKELTDKAFYYHQRGDLASAAKIYKALLEINPDDANILNLSGMLMIASKNYEYAVDYLTKAFIINHSAGIAVNLAKAYFSAKHIEKSIKLYLEALRLSKEQNMDCADDIYYSLGIAYKWAGNIEAAKEAYRNALEQNPGNYSACYNLALACSSTGELEKAVFYAEKCALLRHDDDTLFGMLSSFYEKLGKYKDAVRALEQAISIKPANFLYYYNAAVLSSFIHNDDKSVYYYLKSIAVNPKHIESYVNLANIIKKQNTEKAAQYLLKAYEINPKEELLLLNLAQLYKDTDKNKESLKILKELLLLNPVCADAYSLSAINYMDLFMYEKALSYYDLAVKTAPDNLSFQHGRAVCLKYLGRIDECLNILEKIVSGNKEPDTETKVTLGMLYLQNKEFEKGMKLYRLREDKLKTSKTAKEKLWHPYETLENKIVLVYSNCGLGDSIMYARYLPLLKEKTKNIILQTDKEIAPLMQQSFPDINVIKKSAKLPQSDVILQFMDAPLSLNMDFNSIPFSKGYLKADENLIKMFSKLPEFNNKKTKAGLFWQGNKRIFKNRAVPFAIIKQLAENENCAFYSFQIDADNELKGAENITDLTVHIKDYSDTAALLKNIDVLVTIDSSIAHMAGALGVKTYLLLPKTAEWRWFYDNKTTPWYDSIEIFKQTKSADWQEVITRVSGALSKL